MNVDIQKGRERPVRKNGLVNGLNPYQTVSWIYTLTDIIIAYIFSFQFEEQGIHELLLILLELVNVILYYSFQYQFIQINQKVILIKCNNYCDNHLLQLSQGYSNKSNRSYSEIGNIMQIIRNLKLILNHIVLFVKHMSKKKLNIVGVVINVYRMIYFQQTQLYQLFKIKQFQIISLFDHHCIWLNNCVGDQNYSYFFVLVISLVTFKIFKLALDINLLFDADDLQILVYICIAIDPPILIILIYLLSMHIYFKYKHITTYEYIKSKQDKKQQIGQQQHPKQKQNQNESGTGYGQLLQLDLGNIFDLKSQLSLKTADSKTSKQNYFSNKQDDDKKNPQQQSPSQPQFTQIPSLFTSKPTTPGNDQDRKYRIQQQNSQSQAKDLDEIRDKQIYNQVIAEDSEPQMNESSDEEQNDNLNNNNKQHCPKNSNVSQQDQKVNQSICVEIEQQIVQEKQEEVNKEIENKSVDQDLVSVSNQQSLHAQQPPPPQNCYTFQMDLNSEQQKVIISPSSKRNSQHLIADNCTE